MTAVTLTAPAPGTATANSGGKAASDAGAGFASLLALLAAPAAGTTDAMPLGADANAADAKEGGKQTAREAAPGLAAQPQFILPAAAAAPAQADTAAVPGAGATGVPAPTQALPAATLAGPKAASPAVLDAATQDQPADPALSGVVTASPAAKSTPLLPAKAHEDPAPADGDEPAADPAAPVLAQLVPVLPSVPALPAVQTTVPAKQEKTGQAAPGQTGLPPAGIQAGSPTPAGAAAQAAPSPATAPSAQPLSTAVLPAPAATAAQAVVTAQATASREVPAAPVSDGAVAFGQAAVSAVPAQPAPVDTAAPASPSLPLPRGYTAQLARPLFTVATAGPGQHTMTVEVNPQNLGPVTLQAHSSADGIRIEMFAATSDGRDALRQALPELKRDLAGAGISASLDLSSGGQGSAQGGQDRESFTRRFQTSNQAPVDGRLLEVKAHNTPIRPGLYGPETALDVLA